MWTVNFRFLQILRNPEGQPEGKGKRAGGAYLQQFEADARMVVHGVRSAHVPGGLPKGEAKIATTALETLGIEKRSPAKGKKAKEGAGPGVGLVLVGSWDLKGALSKTKGRSDVIAVGALFLDECAKREPTWAESMIHDAQEHGCGALLNRSLAGLEVTLTGMADEEKEEAKFMAEALGATVTHDFKIETNVVVSSKLNTAKSQGALERHLSEQQEVVVVGRAWLDKCVEQRALVPAWDHRLTCLDDMQVRP